MSNSSTLVKRRSDYTPPNYTIHTVELDIDLFPNDTQVICKMDVERLSKQSVPLILDGEQLIIKSVFVNSLPVENYRCEESQLVIEDLPERFTLEIHNQIDPANNHSLEGLYQSSGAYCTQCEAEGFRKITYFLDRPDVLAEYFVTIHADKSQYPYLLSNGNLVEKGDEGDNRHWVRWHDPFKKPCYLFALVAGDFDLLEDQFTTASGRAVALQLFVDKGKANRGQHALDSLKKAMTWDEQTFGLEYDLDIYMIVAVDFFNMGAMENKGLNIFNSKFVLANEETATDEDYFNIESVIAHEYFHNWTGNRVTCRDWFQLSLKEGLTVFRDQQFSADMTSAVVNRIKNVKVIREHQFAEDASAMSHPIRPDEVIEMNNFYTVTVYDKGAEVIRMLHTLLGQEGFRKGMDLYFQRHDGQAVTCDDFVAAMADANQRELSVFQRWYGQSGTPKLVAQSSYDSQNQRFQLTLTQHHEPTADQSSKQDLHIPVNVELLVEGQSVQSELVNLTQHKQMFEFSNVKAKPTCSLLGNFSAPVRLSLSQSVDELTDIALNSEDGFSRWDASVRLLSQFIHGKTPNKELQRDEQVTLQDISTLISGLLEQSHTDKELLAEMLTIPSIETLAQQNDRFYVDEVHSARLELEQHICTTFSDQWLALCQQHHSHESYQYNAEQVGKRKLKNLALCYLIGSEFGSKTIQSQFENADNMTDTLGALRAAQHGRLEMFDELMMKFEQRWQDDPLVLDKWFALHASTERRDILSRLDLLKSHKQYTINNPNRVRSIYGSFAYYNTQGFHRVDGSGYQYLTDYLMELDTVNPQVSARLVTPLTQWQKLDETRKVLMKKQLARLLDNPNLSKDMFEKVSKSLDFKLQ